MKNYNEQGEPLPTASLQTIRGGKSLTLPRLNREDSGLYTCIASNDVGDGQSNAVALHVDCEQYLNYFKSLLNLRAMCRFFIVKSLLGVRQYVQCIYSCYCKLTIRFPDNVSINYLKSLVFLRAMSLIFYWQFTIKFTSNASTYFQFIICVTSNFIYFQGASFRTNNNIYP